MMNNNSSDKVPQAIFSDPEKHGEGIRNAYTSYLVTTKIPGSSSVSVRRRYGDFHALYKRLSSTGTRKSLSQESLQFQSATAEDLSLWRPIILPKLPSKHRLSYLDRFSDEFIEQRRQNLERWLNKVLEKICNGTSASGGGWRERMIMSFLSNQDPYAWYTLGGFKKEEPAFDDSASTTSSVSSSQTALQYHTTNTFQSSSSSGLLRGMGNALKNVINTHTRPKTPNEDLNKIEESIAIYEQTLASLEKEVSRMIKDYRDLSMLYSFMADSFEYIFGKTFSTDENQASEFKASLLKLSQLFNRIADSEYSRTQKAFIEEHISYCSTVKSLIKTGSRKIVEGENLERFLTDSLRERESLAAGGSGGNTSNMVTNMRSFVKEKYGELKGQDVRIIRQKRLVETESLIDELKRKLDFHRKITKEYSEGLVTEFEDFEILKQQELHDGMKFMCEDHLSFMKMGLEQVKNLQRILALNDEQI